MTVGIDKAAPGTMHSAKNQGASTETPELSIIVVSYGTRDMTIECLGSVVRQTQSTSYEVLVVDNASADGSAEAIARRFPTFHVMAQKENLGFAAANNLAAYAAKGRYLLLLNPDTVVLDRAIDRLHEFAIANSSCRIFGGRTVFADGSLNPGSCWGRITLWTLFCFAVGLTSLKRSRVFNSEGYGGWGRDTIRQVHTISGCFFLIDRQLWQELNGFDPLFFMYGEEADLCERASKLGAKPSITPAATIIHYDGASEPDQTEQRIKVLAGRVTLMRRHWSYSACVLGSFLYAMLPLSRVLVFGAMGSVARNSVYRQKATMWKDVWRHRQRWINGWNDAGVRAARDVPRS